MSRSLATNIETAIRQELGPYSQACEGLVEGALELVKATQFAYSLGKDPWEFAVTSKSLSELGLTETDRRMLVCLGIAEHKVEVIDEGTDSYKSDSLMPRNFAPGKLTEKSCYVLSRRFRSSAVEINPNRPVIAFKDNIGDSPGITSLPIPRWDASRRLLSLAGTVVKRFRTPAKNQEQILNAFEEENWPSRIDDPLPPQPAMDSKQRLRDTVKCLKRCQKGPLQGETLIDFRCDGSGEGILWELTSQAVRQFGGEDLVYETQLKSG